MAAKKSRLRNLLVLGAIGAGLIPLFVVGLFTYMNATKKPLHPAVGGVPSVTLSPPKQEWLSVVEQARQLARASLAEQNLPGISVAVGFRGEIVWAEGFGWADLDDKVKVSPETRFRIGTASTALTSVAAGLLIEQGKLKLDDEVRMYAAGFPKKQWPVTVRQVMAHTAGLRGDGGDDSPYLHRQCERASDALDVFADGEPRYEPGTQYGFSGYGFILVSDAIESITGEPLSRFIRSHVFEPLGMNNTKLGVDAEPISGAATSYFPRFAADPRYGPDLMGPVNFSCYSGASAFVSTPSDLVTFAMAIDGGKLLQPATVQLLQTSQRLPSGEETGYGLGWDIESVTLAGKQARLVGHDGDILGGNAASFMTFPEFGIVIAITSNISYAETHGLAVKLAQLFAERIKAQ